MTSDTFTCVVCGRAFHLDFRHNKDESASDGLCERCWDTWTCTPYTLAQGRRPWGTVATTGGEVTLLSVRTDLPTRAWAWLRSDLVIRQVGPVAFAINALHALWISVAFMAGWHHPSGWWALANTVLAVFILAGLLDVRGVRRQIAEAGEPEQVCDSWGFPRLQPDNAVVAAAATGAAAGAELARVWLASGKNLDPFLVRLLANIILRAPGAPDGIELSAKATAIIDDLPGLDQRGSERVFWALVRSVVKPLDSQLRAIQAEDHQALPATASADAIVAFLGDEQ